MNINFATVDENFIKAKVEAGYYSNATELIRDAVRKLRERDVTEKRSRLLAALEEGERDIAEGRVVPYTPDLVDEILKSARKMVAEGRKSNPDATG